MTSTQSNPTVLQADQEHPALRTAVFILLFLFLVLAFFGIRAGLTALSGSDTPDYAFILSCGGAFPLALALVWLAEKLMKRYWPSGRTITLTSNGLQMQTEADQEWQIHRSQEIVPLFWYFDLRGWQRGGRERRVPRNWLCLAIELKAGKKQVIAYTFATPSKTQSWLEGVNGPVRFHQISPKDVYDNSIRARMSGPSRPEIPAAVLTGADGNYWQAERRRWTEGFELLPGQFELFMNHIQTTLLEL
jgi:hypothetical protein